MNQKLSGKPGAVHYSTTTVHKEDRQGAYDNVHLAPAMTYRVNAGATTHERTAYMAPICHHDCLHIHWRWGAWQDQDHVMGWQGGRPHRKAGAPLIPENQTLHVGVDGHVMEYEPSVENVSQLDWQVFMDHGAGISVNLNIAGYLAGLSEFSSETEVRKYLEGLYDGHDSFMHLTNFYYHNRMLEPAVPGDAAMDEPRLDEGNGQMNFLPLE